jgi:hypothetical protein
MLHFKLCQRDHTSHAERQGVIISIRAQTDIARSIKNMLKKKRNRELHHAENYQMTGAGQVLNVDTVNDGVKLDPDTCEKIRCALNAAIEAEWSRQPWLTTSSLIVETRNRSGKNQIGRVCAVDVIT